MLCVHPRSAICLPSMFSLAPFFFLFFFLYLPCHFSDKINHVHFNLDTIVQIQIMVFLDIMSMCLFINQYTVFLTCLTGWCFYSDNFLKHNVDKVKHL